MAYVKLNRLSVGRARLLGPYPFHFIKEHTMSKIKTLTSGVTAAALVAGIGLAYAQATDPATPTTPPAPTAPAADPAAPTAPASTTPSTTPSSQAPTESGAPSTGTTPMASEPPAQADRN